MDCAWFPAHRASLLASRTRSTRATWNFLAALDDVFSVFVEWQLAAAPVPHPVIPVLAERGGIDPEFHRQLGCHPRLSPGGSGSWLGIRIGYGDYQHAESDQVPVCPGEL
jgi:hypothetical protein